MEGTFLWHSLWEPGCVPGGKYHNTVGAPLWWIPLEFLTLRLVLWASRSPSATVQGHPSPQYMHRFSGRFLPWVSALISCDDVDSPAFLPRLGSSGLPCVLPSLTDPGRVADFSVCLAFYILGWSGDSQPPCMKNPTAWNWGGKPDILALFPVLVEKH